MLDIKNTVKECLQELVNDCNKTTNKDIVLDEVSHGALSPFIGHYVLIRAHRKGTQVGILKSTDNEFLYLQPSRKLWRWWCGEGVALESLAVHGIKEGTKATAICQNDAMRLDDVCGITVISKKVYDQVMDWHTADQDQP